MSERRHGKVLYRFKRTWKDGTRAVALSPMAFIDRLAALVPRPRLPLITYHGVLAPAARLRPAIVPAPPEATPHTPPCETRSHKKRAAPHYYTWAELLKRVFLIDALICDHCQSVRKIVATIAEPFTVRRILDHLGLPAEPPIVANARPPPGCEDGYDA